MVVCPLLLGGAEGLGAAPRSASTSTLPCSSWEERAQQHLCTLQPGQTLLLTMGHGSDTDPCRLLQAPMTVERSVQGILAVLGSLSQETSGAFLDWEGNSLPW